MKNLARKVAVGAAVAGYLVAIGIYFAGSAWHPPVAVVLAICPASFLTMLSMTDPSFETIAVLIGPLNAVVYGVVGFLIGMEIEDRYAARRNTP